MVRYISQRLAVIAVVLLAITYTAFLGMNMKNNWEGEDPGYHLWEDVTAAGRDTIHFLGQVARGDLGEVEMVSGPQPVDEIIWSAYKNSMGLLLMAIVVAGLIGLVIGTLVALRKQGSRAYGLLLLTLLGVSAPSFLLAILLQQAGIKYTQTVGSRLVSMGGFGWDMEHLLLPLLVLVARPIAYLTRASFLSLGNILGTDYMRTALAKGLPSWRRSLVHAFPNLAVPFLTAVGVSLRFSLSSLPIVEFIFAWPGMGLQILDAIRQDIPILVVSLALLIGLTIQLVSLFIDVLSFFIDPRVGAEL